MGIHPEGCSYQGPRGIKTRDVIPFQTEEKSTRGKEGGWSFPLRDAGKGL
jgi:hypothetical protein